MELPEGVPGLFADGAWISGAKEVMRKQSMTIRKQVIAIRILVMEIERMRRMEEAEYGPFE